MFYPRISFCVDHGVMVSVVVSSVVYRGFIGGVMFNVVVSSVVYRGFGGVMVSVVVSSVVYIVGSSVV